MITADIKSLNPSGAMILDIGCGTGRHSCEAVRFEEVTVIASDIAQKEVKSAIENLKLVKGFGECRGDYAGSVSDICHLPFPDSVFDIILCAETLEHVPDDRKAVSELARVLKPCGCLVVSVPRFFPERICWLLSEEYHRSSGGHIRIYRKKKLLELVESFGLTCYRRHFAHSLHSPFWWLKCAIGPDNEQNRAVKLYHRFLVWDIMKKPLLTRTLDRLFNPILGKSLVLYFRKGSL